MTLKILIREIWPAAKLTLFRILKRIMSDRHIHKRIPTLKPILFGFYQETELPTLISYAILSWNKREKVKALELLISLGADACSD